MNMIIEQNVMVPMRDGVKLATDIYRPAEDGQRPVLLIRIPYDKDLRFPLPGWEERRMNLEINMNLQRVIEAGYVVVAQDIRGRYASEGQFTPFLAEAQDGADTIAWAAEQPWSTGQVGMYGLSYAGLTQWRAAMEQPVALRAIIPSQCPYSGGIYPYLGGAFMLAMALTWVSGDFAAEEMRRQIKEGRAKPEDLEALMRAVEDVPARVRHLPLNDQPILRAAAPYYLDWLAHPGLDEYWRPFMPADFTERITIPALTISGWYDIFLRDDLKRYQDLKQRAGSEFARRQQHLIIGPWSHANFMFGYPDRSYGEDGKEVSPQAVEMLTDIQLRWFDHWLKGLDNGVERDKPVRIFVMGIDQWRAEEAWPLPDTHYRPYYLHSAGHANTVNGDGQLLQTAPRQAGQDVYSYDPHNPVPTMSGTRDPEQQGNIGPFDQSEVEQRADVLCYSSEPLEHQVEVTGPLELVLYASSSARDTDFTGKLVDVHPNGRAEMLTDGILRARYRESLAQPTLLEPDHVYELHIDLGSTANVFLAGHRIRLEISSSNFPRFERNPNSGGPVAAARAEDFVPAVNRIQHSAEYPSRLILPIIERAG
ncbi:CocE/NonD family hydrolase [Ktedonosporobacter rubrisoli]|uniref:CocE/NonD family hydrolase n=1 Tax=Ktedonosporobacter rubrisoli TaxID=2509675 RepID=A0A4P6JKX6_KTERU|nr:CocE/NonD family hydrolase [Ktedonosporobacter rubrisoli]QBD75838.1 CocE/NonD family hydrolase [Ktedonosporobacter rubrisoli]